MARNLCPSNAILFVIVRLFLCCTSTSAVTVEVEVQKPILPLVVSEQIFSSIASNSDTLKQSDTLNFSQVLVSANQRTKLEFFKPNENISKSYLCIFHLDAVSFQRNFNGDRRMWIANRNTPIVQDTAYLTIDNTGSLIIRHSRGNPIALYVGNGTHSSNVSATLHDNGNFVLSELNADGSAGETLWQSFDHPTDSFLPEMRLGVDVNNERRFSLTSWLVENDPTSGSFSLDWDPPEKQLVLRRRGIVVWTSGVLKDGNFPHIPQSVVQEVTLLVSPDGNSLSYSFNKSIYWKLADEGTIYFIFANNSKEKFYYVYLPIMDMCYGYNSDNGCVEWLQPNCRSDMPTFRSEGGFFRRIDNNEIVTGIHYDNASVGPGDCRALCWDDCDCIAYSPADDIGCLFWKGKLEFELATEDETAEKYAIISSPIFSKSPFQVPQTSNERKNQWKWLAILLPVSSAVLFVTVIACGVTRKKRDRRKYVARLKEEYLSQCTAPCRSDDSDELGISLKVFDLKTISGATNNFSKLNKLGEGGFGPVYKGTFPGGSEIAVKRLSRSSGQGLVEFRNELKLIAKLQHLNLVRLLGYCLDGEENILVYEYMPNRSLDSFLFDPSKRFLLEWTQRVKIIDGIAKGLQYLHEYSRLMIIHRDLKASNILLDANMNPKISDFGMARVFKRNELMANTRRIVGTYGYMPPEYAMVGMFSVKSDVFSFGVLIIEILSGRRNSSFNDSDQHPNLIGYAWELWKRNAWADLIDPTIKESCSMNQLQKFIHVGLLCVEDSVSDRPTISEVISMLTNENTPLPSVKKPAFLFWAKALSIDSCVHKLDSDKESFCVSKSVKAIRKDTLAEILTSVAVCYKEFQVIVLQIQQKRKC